MPSKSVDRIFGCRSPSSKGIGKWDGAFVYCRDGLQQIMAYFEDNVDYINDEPITFNDVTKEYNKCIEQGWIPMTPEDLEKTSGVTIDEHTKLDIPATDDFDIPVMQITDTIPKENLEKMISNVSEYVKDLKEKNPDFISTITNFRDDMRGQVESMVNDPNKISINQAMELGTKLLGSMDQNMISSLVDITKNMMATLSKDLPKGGTNATTPTLNNLFDSFMSKSDELNEFNKKTDSEKADEIINIMMNKNNPESFDDYINEDSESDETPVVEPENIQ